MAAAVRAADKLLAELSNAEERKWTRAEQAELARVRAAIERIVKVDDIRVFKARWISAAG